MVTLVKYNVLFHKTNKKEENLKDKKNFGELFQRTTSPNIDLREKLKKLENSFTYSKQNNKLPTKEKSNAYINLFTEESIKSNTIKTNEFKSIIYNKLKDFPSINPFLKLKIDSDLRM